MRSSNAAPQALDSSSRWALSLEPAPDTCFLGRTPMDTIARRAFMQGAGLGALAYTVGGVEVLLTPGEARAQGVAFRILTAGEIAALEAIGETIVPGARQGGISHFVDQQLSIPPEEALLEARILNVRPP